MKDIALANLNEIALEAMRLNPGWLDGAVPPPEASKITGVPVSSLETLRIRGGGPIFTKLGKRVLYVRRDLYNWLAENRRASTSNGGV